MKASILLILPLLSGSVFAQTYAPQLNLSQAISTGQINEQKATETIVARNAVSSGAVALFIAGQSVTLQPGFVAQAGSVFVASVERVVSEPNSSDIPGLSVRAYPNPFVESTTVEYTLPVSGPVQSSLLDSQGKVMYESSEQTEQPAGVHQVQVNGRNLPAGVYLYQLQLGAERRTLRLMKKP